MMASYLIRFDDICPTMNWSIWDRLESVLEKHSVKPILAVIPDNKDPRLVIESPRIDFWERVRSWQRRGWVIGLHGYQHVYGTKNPGLMGINNYSEFAGLPYNVQRGKIAAALHVFQSEDIRADAWVAPGHSFDERTLNVLIDSGITVISDGFFLQPVLRAGAFWIPQQLWHFRPMPFGIWTVCFHHNRFTPPDVVDFETGINQFKHKLISMDSLVAGYPARHYFITDYLVSKILLFMLQCKLKYGKK